MKVKNFLKSFSYLFLSFLLISLNSISASAEVKLPSGREEEFAENNLVFYDPDGCSGYSNSSSGSYSAIKPSSGKGTEKLKQIVKQYGEYAMELQKKYGSPWEVIFAQMMHESGMGTAGVALGAASMGGYNWLGITGSGDKGTYQKCPSCRKWAVFSSMESMMDAWAGKKVLRNGYYDKAFKYLDPDNYNLDNFLSSMISVYAPASDGNDVSNYVSTVKGLIEGPIAEVRKEMGWKSSAELAKDEQIKVGGKTPLGSSVSGGSSNSSSSSTNNWGSVCGDTTNGSHGSDDEGEPYTGDFPQYYQGCSHGGEALQWCSLHWDKNGATKNGSGSTIAYSGCGPSSFAMLATALLQRKITPKETADIAGKAGMHESSGSSWDITKVLADHYGLDYKDIGTSSKQAAITAINKALKDGWMIHTSGAHGLAPFSSNGHYIGIYGIDDQGRWLVADSSNRGNKAYKPETVVDGMHVANIKAIRKK